jgi:hypothetical protein
VLEKVQVAGCGGVVMEEGGFGGGVRVEVADGDI